MFEEFLNNTYLIGLIAIMVNGVVTGFAVYLGSHSGQRVIDRFKEHNGTVKTEKEIIKEITAQFEENLERLKKIDTKKDGK